MALDLEEQEKIAALKGWWSEHGTLVTALAVGIALAVAGWQGWRWYERQQTAQAAGVMNEAAAVFRVGTAQVQRKVIADGLQHPY